MGLEADEREAQEEGEREKQGERAALARLQGVMRDRDGESAGQQDCGVDCGDAECRDGVERGVRQTADMSRSAAGPGGFELRPEEVVGGELHALAAEPGHRQDACVEQCAEERCEEHHFREDEPHHSHAERAVHLQVVDAVLILADHGGEPAGEHVGQQQRAGDEHPAAARPLVQERDGCEHDGEERDRPDDRPLAVMRNVIRLGV